MYRVVTRARRAHKTKHGDNIEAPELAVNPAQGRDEQISKKLSERIFEYIRNSETSTKDLFRVFFEYSNI